MTAAFCAGALLPIITIATVAGLVLDGWIGRTT